MRVPVEDRASVTLVPGEASELASAVTATEASISTTISLAAMIFRPAIDVTSRP